MAKSLPQSIDELFNFPCPFEIKAMGRADGELLTVVTGIVFRHIVEFDVAAVQVRPSKAGNYMTVKVPIIAQSRPQLDALYRELSAHPEVLWLL